MTVVAVKSAASTTSAAVPTVLAASAASSFPGSTVAASKKTLVSLAAVSLSTSSPGYPAGRGAVAVDNLLITAFHPLRIPGPLLDSTASFDLLGFGCSTGFWTGRRR